MKFPWKFLLRNLKTSFKLMIDEFNHIKYVVSFFKVRSHNESKPEINLKNSTDYDSYKLDISIRSTVGRLYDVIDILKKENICHISLSIKEMEEIIKKESFEKSNFYLISFLNEFVKSKKKMNETAKILDFMQKKLASLLQGYPSYYPTPKETSIRESVKIHRYMERLSTSFLSLLISKDNRNITNFNSYFYWDFLPEISFFPCKRFLIFNTDFILPHRQSFWTILFHEVIHYLLDLVKNDPHAETIFIENRETYKLLTLMLDYSKRISENINLLSQTKRIRFPIDFFDDAVIDSLIGFIFGPIYLLTGFYNLLFFDDESFIEPRTLRTWYYRLYATIIGYKHYLKSIKDEEKSYNEKIFKILEEVIHNVYDLQRKYSPRYSEKSVFELETIVKPILTEFLHRFLNNKITKLIANQINNCNDLYIKFFKLYLNSYLENLYNKEIKDDKSFMQEGRALCIIFNDISCFGNTEYVTKKEIIELFDREVHLFQIFKIRYDADGLQRFVTSKESKNNRINVIKKIAEFIKDGDKSQCALLYSFGSYSFLLYYGKHNEKELNLKEDMFCRDSFVIQFKKESEKSANVQGTNKKEDLVTEKLFNQNILFFKEDLSLTLLSKTKNSIRFDELEESIMIIINLQLSRNKNDLSLSIIENMIENNVKEIQRVIGISNKDIANFYLFTSFSWHDICCVLLIKPYGKEIKLSKVLFTLKEGLLINNHGLFTRTETNIFIGRKIINNVIVSFPHVHLRVSSDYLGKSLKEIIEPLKQKDYITHIDLRFGIRDIVIKIKNCQDGIPFCKLLDYLYGPDGLLTAVNFKLSDLQVVTEVNYWNKYQS